MDAPKEGKPTVHDKWLIRQLKSAPDSVRVEAFVANQRGPGAAEVLGVVRASPAVLIKDPNREIRSFRVALSVPMGAKRRRGRGAFIDSVLDLVDTFSCEVLEHLKAWAAALPRCVNWTRPTTPLALASTSLSPQDGPEQVTESLATVALDAGSCLRFRSR